MSIAASAYVKALRRRDGINASEKGFLMVLADYHNAEMGYAWVSLERLREDCCIESKNTVLAHITAMEALGILHIERRMGRNGGNHYFFPQMVQNMHPLSAIKGSVSRRNGAIKGSVSRRNGAIAIAPERDLELQQDLELIGDSDTPHITSEEPSTPDSAQAHLWSQVLDELHRQIPKHSFDTWLAKSKAARSPDGGLIVAAPTKAQRDWLEKRFGLLVRRIVQRIAGREIAVAFVEEMEVADVHPP